MMNMIDLVYVCGAPAAGKSTLMAALTSGCQKLEVSKPIPYMRLIHARDGYSVGIELGRNRPKFPGTDTLAMNIAPAAMRFIASLAHAEAALLILGEGDRLGFPGFLEVARDIGANVYLVHLQCAGAEMDRRCAERGSSQSPAWRKGRETKAARLALWAAEHHLPVIHLESGACQPDILADALRNQIPALSILP